MSKKTLTLTLVREGRSLRQIHQGDSWYDIDTLLWCYAMMDDLFAIQNRCVETYNNIQRHTDEIKAEAYERSLRIGTDYRLMRAPDTQPEQDPGEPEDAIECRHQHRLAWVWEDVKWKCTVCWDIDPSWEPFDPENIQRIQDPGEPDPTAT